MKEHHWARHWDRWRAQQKEMLLGMELVIGLGISLGRM
jgi:hypothetical protein